MIIFGGFDGDCTSSEITIFENKKTLKNKKTIKTKTKGRKGHKAINWKDKYMIIYGGEDEDETVLSDFLIFDLHDLHSPPFSFPTKFNHFSPISRSFHSFDFYQNQVK